MNEPTLRRPRRVGHKGAHHIEPGNTLASFDAALAHDVDMIELERVRRYPVRLAAHSEGHQRAEGRNGGRTPITMLCTSNTISRRENDRLRQHARAPSERVEELIGAA